MTGALGAAALGASAALVLYPYLFYPLALKLLGGWRPLPPPRRPGVVGRWPTVSVTVPAYNEEGQIRDLLESLLALEYPRELLQILIVSDASSDGTDEIVREYEGRGVELLRMSARSGKTAAENAARYHLRGEVIVNTDASVRIRPGALRHLVAALDDPVVGVASGRDVSVSTAEGGGNDGEAGYVGYEMWVRDLENRVGGIVGASGCLYAIRRELHRLPVPPALSRDFIAALNARERGFRSVSVSQALCAVPRTPSLLREYRRKVRTLTRGMATLWHKRRLLSPLRFGTFSWMLLSHKVARWMLPWAVLLGVAGLALLAPGAAWAGWVLAAGALGGLVAVLPWLLEWRRGGTGRLAGILVLPAYVAGGVVAAAHAAVRVFGGRGDPVWEPTRREGVGAATSPRSSPP